MSDADPKRESPPATRARSRAPSVAASVTVLVVLSGLGFWVSGRARAHGPLEQARQAAGDLNACVTRVRAGRPSLYDALALRFPDERPFAECAPAFERLVSAHAELDHASFLRVRSDIRRLGEELEQIRRVGLDATTAELVDRPLSSLESAAGASLRATCRMAAVELGQLGESCFPSEPPPPPAALASRLVLEASSNVPFESVETVAFAHADERVNLALTARERYSEHFRAWLLSSDDGAMSFTTASLDGPAIGAGPLDPPRLSELGEKGEPHYLVVSRHDQNRRALGVVLHVGAGRRLLESVRALPEAPTGFDFADAGAPLVELATKQGPVLGFALASTKPDAPGGRVLYAGPDARIRERDAPAGHLLALSATRGPRIIVAESAGDASAVAAYPLPGPDDDWSKSPERVGLPRASYRAEATSEQACGLSDEKYFSLVASDGARAAFVALGESKLFALSFERPKGSVLVPSCGSCPPTLLEKTESSLGLLLPAGRIVTSVPVRTAISYAKGGKSRSAASACAAGHYAVAYVAGGRALVETTGPSSWAFSAPRVLAEPNEQGEPSDVHVLGLGGRLVVLWRRSSPDQKHFRIELLASDDGGATWR